MKRAEQPEAARFMSRILEEWRTKLLVGARASRGNRALLALDFYEVHELFTLLLEPEVREALPEGCCAGCVMMPVGVCSMCDHQRGPVRV